MKFNPRHFAKWIAICGISGLPSFILGMAGMQANIPAMVTGIFLFAIGYTFISSGAAFERLRQKTLVRRAFLFGAVLRLGCSVIGSMAFMFAFLFAGAVKPLMPLINLMGICASPDMLLGALSTQVIRLGGQDLYHTPAGNFLLTLATTLVQGILLNILMLLTMVLAFLVQVAWGKIRKA